MMALRDLSGGAVGPGNGSLACPSEVFGGVLISTDGVNLVTLTVRRNDGAGAIVFQMSTKSPLPVFAPFEADAVIYYTLTGAGGSAQLFEWYDG